MLNVFEEDVLSDFTEQLKCDKLAEFVKSVPKFAEARSWDKVRVEIDFNSALADFDFFNARDLAKVAAVFPILYSAVPVDAAIELCLELLAACTFIRD